MYVCNCNGIRERDVALAVEDGADRPAQVFRRCQARPQCAKCVPDMWREIEIRLDALKLAAE